MTYFHFFSQVFVYDNDIDQIIFYIATIINYLYALPYCTEKIKVIIKKEKRILMNNKASKGNCITILILDVFPVKKRYK